MDIHCSYLLRIVYNIPFCQFSREAKWTIICLLEFQLQMIGIHLYLKPSFLSFSVELIKFLPGWKMQTYLRFRIQNSQITSLHSNVGITITMVVLCRELHSSFPATVKQIIQNPGISRCTASFQTMHPERYRLCKISSTSAIPDQIMFDPQSVCSFPIDSISIHLTRFRHCVPAGRPFLLLYLIPVKPTFHIPDDIVVDQIHTIFRTFYENSLSLLPSI